MKSGKSILLCLLLFSINLCSYSQLTNITRHWNTVRGYLPFKTATAESLIIDNKSDTLQYDYLKLDYPASAFSLDFRARNNHSSPGKKYSYFLENGEKRPISHTFWGFFVTMPNDTLLVKIEGKEIISEVESFPVAEVISSLSSGFTTTKNFTKELEPYNGDNLWKITFEHGVLSVDGGDHSLAEIIAFSPIEQEITGFGFYAGWGADLRVSDINLEYSLSQELSFPAYNIDNIEVLGKNSEDELIGLWSLYDRELDESLLRLGGDYLLGCIRDEDNYLFIYISGANVGKDNWKEGDIKAILSPTPFPGIYNVTWFDSMRLPLSHDIKAQTGEGNTLTIQFPYQSSKIRLRKIP